jgi:ankyrin repeat protein
MARHKKTIPINTERLWHHIFEGFPEDHPNESWSPLGRAIYQGDAATVKWLMEAVRRPASIIKGEELLDWAIRICQQNRLEVIRSIVEASPEPQSIVLRCNNNQLYPVFQAAAEGDIEVFDYLQNIAPVDINHQDTSGMTMLHYAFMTSQLDMARHLQDCGAKCDIPDKAGHLPMDYYLKPDICLSTNT